MARPHPISVGLVAVSALVIGLEVYLLHRPRHRAEPAVSDEPPFAETPPPAPPAVLDPAPGPAPAPASAALSPPPPPVPSPAPTAAAIPAGPDAASDQGPAQIRRPLFVAPEPDRVIRDADEQAFEALHLPEATRAAIRKINEAHAAAQRALRDGLVAIPEGLPTRREAIEHLLGVDGSQQFDAAERAATKRLHSRYRWQSLHGMAPGDVTRQ